MWRKSIALTGLFCMTSMTSAATPPTNTLRILATSDVHGHFTGFNYFADRYEPKGLAYTAELIKAARQQADASVLIENGDLIQGSPFTDWMVTQSEQHAKLPLAQLLNYLNYDAANLGNHEFNYGLEYLAAAYHGLDAPVLSANLIAQSDYAKQQLNHRAYTIIERDMPIGDGKVALKIGLVGVLPPQIMQWDTHHLAEHVQVEAMRDAAEREIQQARAAGADLVVLVAHTGMPKHSDITSDSEQAVWELAQIEGVDAIIFGHQHELFPGTSVYDQLANVDSQKGTIFGVPAVQPGVHGEYLGVIDLTLSFDESHKTWHVESHQSTVLQVGATRDARVNQMLASAHTATLAFMKQSIGTTRAALSQQYARLQPTLAMQLIHDAQLWYIERYVEAANPVWQNLPRLSAAAPFHAALDANDGYTLIEPGAVTLGDIGDLYRYPNTLEVVKIKGAALKQWLEESAKALTVGQPNDRWSWVNKEIPSYHFDTFKGLNYEIDPTQKVGQRVSTADDINDEQDYVVITNNYRASGGGDFANLDGSQIIYRAPDQLQHILIEYLKSLGEKGYSPEFEVNWKLVAGAGFEPTTFGL